MKYLSFSLLLLFLFACKPLKQEDTDQLSQKRPNIVLIMGDDIGYPQSGSIGLWRFTLQAILQYGQMQSDSVLLDDRIV